MSYSKTSVLRFFAVGIVSASLLSSCSLDDAEAGINERVVKGGDIAYGGTLTVSEDETFSTIFPLEVVDVASSKVTSQLHDGLLKFNAKDLSLEGAIAKSWEVDESNTVYTFKLNDNVRFHDDVCFKDGKGRILTAADVKFTFELLCTKDFEINYNQIFKPYLKGSDDYFNGTSKEVSGIEIVDDFTIKLTLNQPSSSFLYVLAMPNTSIIAKEAYEKYGKNMTVGTGAFKWTKPADETKEVYLVYNEKYYRKDSHGNALPYLDTVHFIFNPSKLDQLELFNTGKLSAIHGLPSSKIAEVVEQNIENFKNQPPKTILFNQPELNCQYYEFVTTKAPFDNVKVRKAISYAINRNKIVSDVLNNQGSPGAFGITPKIPSFNTYDFSRIEGYSYNPELAKQLLAEAGYPDGKGFPNVRLEINLGGSVHKQVASEIQQQLYQVLGIKLEIEQVSFKDKIENSKYGKSEMYRSAWVADYPSPESFLSIFYGGNVPESMDMPSHPNTTRYKNPVFDSLYLKALSTANQLEQYNLFAEAEKVMMQDAPIVVLWYAEDYILINSNVQNYFNNAMLVTDMSIIYIKDSK
jgi:oligopeptide transport system substrate-binding protein